MNLLLKAKLEFVIRVVNEHGYKIKILKDQEQPKEVDEVISVSPPKYINGKNMLTFHKYIKNKGFSSLALGENHDTTEHYIKQFLGVETDCPVCYSTLGEFKVCCQKCIAIICETCSKQLARCPICQNEEWTMKHGLVREVLNCSELSDIELCALFADEYREEYEKFTGEDTRNSVYSASTLNQQISRYSKRLAFWQIKSDELDERSNFYTPDDITTYIQKQMFFTNNLEYIIQKMYNDFSLETSMEISRKAYKLKVSARNNK